MKTVVHIGYGGGVTTMMRDLSSEMDGVQFIVLTFGPSTVKTTRTNTSFVWQGMFRLDKYISNFHNLQQYLKTLRPNLVVLHGFIPMALLALPIKRSIEGEVVGIDVGPQPTFWLIKKIIFWFSRNAINEVVSVCEESKDWFVKSYPWFKKRAGVINNGVDAPKKLTNRIRFQKTPFVISTVSRIDTPQKDPLTLFQAGLELRKQNVPIEIRFVGDGNLLPSLKKKIVENNAQSYIHCLGHRTDYQSVLDESDIFVLSTNWEGLALSLLEAMANGLPVVASKVIGNTGVITDGITGRLFTPGDYKQLADIIIELIKDPIKAKQIGANGTTEVSKKYTRSRMIFEYQQWFAKLLE